MLKDNIDNIDKYLSLDVSLSGFRRSEMETAEECDSFVVDSYNTTLFLVEKGEATFALSWRENENNREVLAVMKAGEGEFVLYLPGEPFTFRKSPETVIKEWGKV